MADVPLLDGLLAPEGWPYASAPPVEPGDPGRFHCLFGRDSLITSLQVLPARPDVARATLRELARLQGRAEDPETDEEPGKIVHEYRPQAPERFAYMGWPVRDGELRYYGTADATSWFLVVLAALRDRRLADELEVAWRGAAGWLERALERGDGLVRHGPRRGTGGLMQQGWRDAVDPAGGEGIGGGILRADGTAPVAPLADADTQAAALAACNALQALSGEHRWERIGRDLRSRVEECFGDAETLAIEADGTGVSGAGSQLGWLLWAGALSPDAAARCADRLAEPDVLTPFGLRTLAESAGAFDPRTYHRGSIWPFDNWLCWGGLRAAGHAELAERVRAGVLAALERLGRAPELYTVADGELETIPIANHVQAWTVGAAWALRAGWDGRAVQQRPRKAEGRPGGRPNAGTGSAPGR